MYTVAIFMVDRAYGGPEEGGWYYDCGEPADEYCEHTRGFADDATADNYASELNSSLVQELNRGRRSINSVLSEGQYAAIVCEGNPKRYPETRPHYE